VTFAGTGGPLTLSQNILALSSGQTITVTISGGTPPYFVANGTSSVTQESVNGNILTVYGEASGTSSVSVCSSGGGCSILAVTVNGATGTTFSLGESALSLVVGGSASVGLSGNGSYYLSTNTEPTVASVSINGSTAAVVGLTAGNTTATLCESNGSCATLSIAVAGTTAPITTTSTIFTEYLVPGDQDAQVLALQQLLVAQGDMTATPNGYFGPATEAGVLKFQAAHNISQVGTVGPETRAALNALGGGGSITNGGTTLSQLQAQAQSLEAQLTQVLAEISQLAGQ
jgi:ferredoxin